jgi:hypothetical protein
MRYIIALLLCYTISIAGDTQPQLLKKIVTGGNGNATLGQVVAGYKNGFHIGIRTPKKVALSVDETITNDVLAYPNPTQNGMVSFGINDIQSVQISDVFGKVVFNGMDIEVNTITLPHRGVFYIQITTHNKQVYSTKVIFN